MEREGFLHDRSGTEPLSARSPLRLRAILSGLALIAGLVVAVVFGLWGARGTGPGAGPWVVAAIGGALALIAVVDLLVIRRRSRE